MSSSIISTIFIILLIPTFIYAANEKLPDGAIQAGSLANQKLQNDAQSGVIGKTVQLGCNKPETYHTYIAKRPKGKPGSRLWEEIWVVIGCDKKYPIHITFQEDGLNSATWFIK